MSLAALLLLYAGLAGWGVDWALSRWRRLHQIPRIALSMWHATALGSLTAVVAALLMLAHDVWEHGLAWLLHADKARIHDLYAGQSEVPALWNGTIALLMLIVSAFTVLLVRGVLHIRREALAHQLLARTELAGAVLAHEPSVGLVDHPVPAIYCVAGTRASTQILVTRGAMVALSRPQLDAAIEHERAHIRGHHHAMIVLADSLRRLTRPFGFLRHYPDAIGYLIELAADDAAARRHGRLTVATALLEMCAAIPAEASSTLSWIGSDPAARIKRLAGSPPAARGCVNLSLLVAATFALAAMPLAATIGPALTLIGTQHQSLSIDSDQPPQRASSDAFVHHE